MCLKITYIKAVILPQERSQREILITFSARIAHAFNYTGDGHASQRDHRKIT